MQEYRSFWNHYLNFEDRASRQDFWVATIGNFIVDLILLGASSVIHPLTVLYGLYSLAAIIPAIAISIRRLHDIGRSGWWLLIYWIPLVGPIILLVWFLTPSGPDNVWGSTKRFGSMR